MLMLMMLTMMVAMLSQMMLILFFLGAGPLLVALLLFQFLFGLTDRQCRIFPSFSSSTSSSSPFSSPFSSTGKMMLKLLFFTGLPPVNFNGGLVTSKFNNSFKSLQSILCVIRRAHLKFRAILPRSFAVSLMILNSLDSSFAIV